MAKTNNLNSHHPERKSHRADKMSGIDPKDKEYYDMRMEKKMANKKRRSVLKTDKI